MSTMRISLLASLAAATLFLADGVAAQAGADPAPEWSTAVEAPDMARVGEWTVGTRRETLAVPARPGFGAPQPAELGLRLFFPAASPGEQRAEYTHAVQLPLAGTIAVKEHGLAFADAAPASGETFPLVVISHGYGGWAEHLSRLAELLASHGYVVAAIDHADAGYANAPEFFASFGEVMLRRSYDQRAVMAALLDGSLAADLPVDRKVPAGLIGYSMGGYGALGTAGATYDGAAQPLSQMPAPLREGLAAITAQAAPKLGAVVTIAPWGGQPDSRMWTAEALGKVTAPVLMIGGSEDSVVDYDEGLRWIFDGLAATERRLLTLREAQHNIAGNAATLPADADPRFLSYYGEPVWRGERLNQVVGHFVAAFLDAELKHDAAARAYLDVPTEDANDGQWPLAFGDQGDGTTADDDEPGYWRGFHRGRALGMSLEFEGGGK